MDPRPNVETTRGSLLLRVRDPADQASWTEFEHRYGELIRRYCTARGVRGPDIDDVSQLVWCDLARGLRQFEYDARKGRFRAYLGRVVRSAIARYFRRHAPPHQRLDTAIEDAVGENDTDDIWQQEWVNHHYRLAMATIEQTFEPRSVAIFRLLIDGRPAAEVAVTHDTTVPAVNQIKHRIRTRLTELIERQVREEDHPDTEA